MRASKKKSGIVDGHFGPLRRAPAESKSLCGWRSFVNGRAYDYQTKKKKNSTVVASHESFSHTFHYVTYYTDSDPTTDINIPLVPYI